MIFHKDILRLDCETETAKICSFISQQINYFKRDGAVIGLSGGVDSALCATLCIMALGKERVLGLILPERESNPASSELAIKHAKEIGLDTIKIDITPVLEGFGTYSKRDAVIKEKCLTTIRFFCKPFEAN